ncbi:MAG: SDR family oxidoreductase [Acidimicrobiales bacterium]|nr:SDR family oxidoreductase [Acidimicrobiales bacterium]
MSTASEDRQRVAVVTGGGNGIGAAIATELGRAGVFVVTVDPLVSVDGVEQLPDPEDTSTRDTTAGRIVAAGGSARSSSLSVTDREGVVRLFADLADELGGVDAVVNVAGITRQMSYTEGTEDDWRSVLAVHLDGWLNVLEAALPVMAAQGHGHVLGVTSGSGWRPADTGAYGCAKRAVASLVWQLGGLVPSGVVVNAVSPIAVTRMVLAAMERQRAATPQQAQAKTSGLALGARMPTPEQLGPVGAHLVGPDFAACRGQVIFVAGAELALVERPRLLEVVGTTGVASLAHALESITATALAPAEAGQASTGGGNPRLAAALGSVLEDGAELPAPVGGSCLVVSDRPDVTSVLTAALGARGLSPRSVDAGTLDHSFAGTAAALAEASEAGPVDAVVVALAGTAVAADLGPGWERTLAEHTGIAEQIYADAAWSRAVADQANASGRPVRLVTLTDAAGAGGRSRAQAVAQHARSAKGATDGRLAAFAVAVETADPGDLPAVGELAAHLVGSPEAPALSGAELVVGPGWLGLRSHPRVGASLSFHDHTVAPWLDDVLADLAGDSRPGGAPA